MLTSKFQRGLSDVFKSVLNAQNNMQTMESDYLADLYRGGNQQALMRKNLYKANVEADRLNARNELPNAISEMNLPEGLDPSYMNTALRASDMNDPLAGLKMMQEQQQFNARDLAMENVGNSEMGLGAVYNAIANGQNFLGDLYQNAGTGQVLNNVTGEVSTTPLSDSIVSKNLANANTQQSLGEKYLAEMELANARSDSARMINSGKSNVFDSTNQEWHVAPSSPGTVNEHQQKGMTVYGPDGSPIVSMGNGQPVPSLKESESKTTLYATRANIANQNLDKVLNIYDPTTFEAGFDKLATGNLLTNWMASGEGQQYINAGKDFIAQVLRKDTGAAVTDEEWRMYSQIYLPLPGDDQSTVQQKAMIRELVVQALRNVSGEGAPLVDSMVNQATAPPPGTVEDGYRFIGGDPANPNNWEPLQ